MSSTLSSDDLFWLTKVYSAITGVELVRNFALSSAEVYWLIWVYRLLHVAKYANCFKTISFGVTKAPQDFKKYQQMLMLLVDSLKPGEVLPQNVYFKLLPTRAEAEEHALRHARELHGDQHYDRHAGEPIQRHEAEWYEHYPSSGTSGRILYNRVGITRPDLTRRDAL